MLLLYFELEELEVSFEEVSPGLNGWLNISKNPSIPLNPNIPAVKSDNFHAKRFRQLIHGKHGVFIN